MPTVNIHEAKTHLSRLLDQAMAGEEIIIAKAGKPIVKLVPIDAAPKKKRQLGLYAGQFSVPDDFDTAFQDEIIALFEGHDSEDIT
jgi:prevent-host-death family protein